MKEILFIAEKSILNSSIAYSNDLNLLLELLKENSTAYLVNPEDIILSINKDAINVMAVSIEDFTIIDQIKKSSYLKSALFMLFSLPLSHEFKEKTTINNFLTTQIIQIKKSQINIIIDRTEPISRTEEYYQAILGFNNKNYFDDPIFRQENGDKEIVLKIDQELTDKKQNNIGFKTIILDFAEENTILSPKNRHKLYDIFQNLKQGDLKSISKEVLDNFINISQKEQGAVIKIIEKIYDCKINFDYFCIKPENWYGGVAIELIGNKNQAIKAKFSKIDLFHHIAKIQQNILTDVKKTNQDQELILKRAVLNAVIIQEQVYYPEFGDLRIFVSFGKIQGVILRVPAKNKNIANMAAGGHAELFINPIAKNQQELDLLQKELQEIGQSDIFDAIMNAIKNIQNSLETKIGTNIKNSAFIGFDALLDENMGKKYFSCNEINLSSAMGQNQIETANLLEELLKNINIYYLLLRITYKLLKINNISYSDNKLKSVISPFIKFILLQKLTENLTDAEKLQIIDELYLQIKDINFNMVSIAQYTINKITNG